MKIEIPEKIYCCLTKLNPEWNIKIRYFMIYKKKFPTKNPVTFVEKLLYLRMKYYNKSEFVAKCSDKVEVRVFLKEKGLGNFLNNIYGIYNTADEFFEAYKKLPESFVMKWNFGCGFNIICDNTNKIDIKKIKMQMEEWKKKRNNYLVNAEMQYGQCTPKVLVEKYLKMGGGGLPIDYKIYCFDGKAKGILVISDRDTERKAGFYSIEWKYHDIKNKPHIPLKDAKKPYSLKKMIDCAERLSEGIPFVRVDFYEIDGIPIFGEMTFSPASGFYVSDADIDGKSMADYIDLNKEYPLLQ